MVEGCAWVGGCEADGVPFFLARRSFLSATKSYSSDTFWKDEHPRIFRDFHFFDPRGGRQGRGAQERPEQDKGRGWGGQRQGKTRCRARGRARDMGRGGCRGRGKGRGRNKGKDNAGAGGGPDEDSGRAGWRGRVGGRAGLGRARYGRLN